MGYIKDEIQDVIHSCEINGRSRDKIGKRLVEAGLAILIEEGLFHSGKKLLATGPNGGFTLAQEEPDEMTAEQFGPILAEVLCKTFAPYGGPVTVDDTFVVKFEHGVLNRPSILRAGIGKRAEVIESDPDPEPSHGYSAGEIERLNDGLRDSAEMFDGYAKLHLAKSPPDFDKAVRNVKMAARLYDLLGEPYVRPTNIDATAENPAVQHDSGVSGTPTPPLADFASGEALSRSAVLAWFDGKLDGATKHGMRDTYNVLAAMRSELAAHLEEQPINVEEALRQFYASVHADNVKAGWWTDLATGQPKNRSVGEMFMLFVTEIVEAYDAYVKGLHDDKLPRYPGLGVELGDLQIRLADFCGALALGRIVEDSGAKNVGDTMFNEVCEIAAEYEKIRKTPEAKGEPEKGDPIEPMDVPVMITDKRGYNANREDHKLENRMKEGGKVT